MFLVDTGNELTKDGLIGVMVVPKKTALLVGGSGLIGGHCLDYLLNDNHYSQVIALGRTPLSIKHPKLIQIQINFDHIKDHLSKIKTNDVYCCLGTTIKKAGSRKAFHTVDCSYPSEIAKLCIANGAEQFLLVSALGANQNSVLFYNRVKGEVEQAVSQYGFQGVYIFRPSLLLGKRPERRPLEELWGALSNSFSFGFKGIFKKYKPIQGKAVAFSMVPKATGLIVRVLHLAAFPIDREC